MAPRSSTLVWTIPWMEEPGRLPSMGLLRVGHDRATSLSLFTFMLWRGKWQPTPVCLPGESQGWQGLVGCRLWGRTGLDTTEVTQQQQQQQQQPFPRWESTYITLGPSGFSEDLSRHCFFAVVIIDMKCSFEPSFFLIKNNLLKFC